MTNNKLINDIKKLIVELKDEEAEAKKLERERPDNAAYFQGLSIGRMSARVSLECLIEEHGHHKPSCVESELRERLHKIAIRNSIVNDFALGMHDLFSSNQGAIIVDDRPVDGAKAKEALAQSVAVEEANIAQTLSFAEYRNEVVCSVMNKCLSCMPDDLSIESIQLVVDVNIPSLETEGFNVIYPNAYCIWFVRLGGYSSGNPIFRTKVFTDAIVEWLCDFKVSYTPLSVSEFVSIAIDKDTLNEVTEAFLKDNGLS